MKKTLIDKQGITLISLVVTIIVLLILAGISISILTGNNGVLNKASDAKIMTELSKYKEELDLYKITKTSENINFLNDSLTAGKTNLFYNTQESGETGNIKTIIPDLNDTYFDQMEIIKGELLINTQDKSLIKNAQSLNIKVNPYDIVEGELLSSNGNLLLMDNEGTITIPDSVTKIGEGAFSNVEGLKTIIIPGTVKEILKDAFSYNNSLERVIMQEGVEKISERAFFNCKNLKEVKFADSISSIGIYAFYKCSNLTEITLPLNLKAVEMDCFSDCTKLSSITLNERLESMSTCFKNTPITSISIPSSVTTIGAVTFTGCSQLTNIDVNNNNNFTFSDGVLIDSQYSVVFITSNKILSSSTFQIPEGVKKFNFNLKPFTNITKIIIPTSLETLQLSISSNFPKTVSEIEISSENTKFSANNGFLCDSNNKLLMCYSKDTNIIIPEYITEIRDCCFACAADSSTIKISNSLNKIGYEAFTNGPSNCNIIIGDNITDIDPTFLLSNRTATITLSNSNSNYTFENNVLYSKDKKILVTVINAIQNEFTIPTGVETISKYAFYNQYSMTNIVLPNTIKNINVSAFNNCTALTTIHIPNSITNIEKCFVGCNALGKIEIDKSKNSISGAPWGAPKGMKVVYWNN